MIHQRLIDNQVKMSVLARKLLNKSSINVVVVNRKTWSAYHCILDYVIYLLIRSCINLIGSDTMTASRPVTHHLENYKWIEFT